MLKKRTKALSRPVLQNIRPCLRTGSKPDITYAYGFVKICKKIDFFIKF